MPLSKQHKLTIAGALVGVVALFFAVEGARFWWYRGYSKGTRTGVVRKVSLKGPPYCKYVAGEMALQGTLPGQPAEIWEFSLDDSSDSSPLYKQLHDAEKAGTRATLAYRQDLGSMWRCTPSEYFVTAIEP